jgi:uncharacterized protein YdiU (UPF0061 family)
VVPIRAEFAEALLNASTISSKCLGPIFFCHGPCPRLILFLAVTYLNSSIASSKGRLPQFIASTQSKKRKRFEIADCQEELKEIKDDKYTFIQSYKKMRKEKEDLESEVVYFKNTQGNFVPRKQLQEPQPNQQEQAPSKNIFDMSSISKTIRTPVKQRMEGETYIVQNEDSQQVNEGSQLEDGEVS